MIARQNDKALKVVKRSLICGQQDISKETYTSASSSQQDSCHGTGLTKTDCTCLSYLLGEVSRVMEEAEHGDALAHAVNKEAGFIQVVRRRNSLVLASGFFDYRKCSHLTYIFSDWL